MSAFVYIVRCADDTLYTGWTINLDKRVKMHNQGMAAKYTKARRPVELVYWEQFCLNNDAMKREREIKKLSRDAKLDLYQGKHEENM